MRRIIRLFLLLFVLGADTLAQDDPPPLGGVWRAKDRLTQDKQYYRVTVVGDRVFCEVYGGDTLVWNAKRTSETQLEGELRIQPIDVGGGRIVGTSGWFAHTIELGADGLAFSQKVGERLRDLDEEETAPPRTVRGLDIYKTRFGELKQDAIHQFGIQSAVPAIKRGLAWLARQQQSNGRWLHKPTRATSAAATTAFALLAFMADGHTETTGKHKGVVTKGLQWLVTQVGNGSFGGPRAYTTGLCALAMVEAYAMGEDKYRAAAQKALAYIVKVQRPAGGWMYTARDKGLGDTSVTGMMFQPLKQGEFAFLATGGALGKARAFIETVTKSNSHVGYRAKGATTGPLMAIGNLVRIYTGASITEPRVAAGLQYVLSKKSDTTNYYFIYYGTMLAFLAGGDSWTAWRDTVQPSLLRLQVKEGKNAGSWRSNSDYMTDSGISAMAILSLAAPYRYVPGRVHRRPGDWKAPVRFERVGVARGIDPPTIAGEDEADFTFQVVGTELGYAGAEGADPQPDDITITHRGDGPDAAPRLSGLEVTAVAVQNDGSLEVSGRFKETAERPIFGTHAIKLEGAVVARGASLRLRVRRSGLRIEGPAFCLVKREIELTAEADSDVPLGWRLAPEHAGTLDPNGLLGSSANLTAGESGRVVTVSVSGLREEGDDPPPAPTVEHEVILWDLKPEARTLERRVHPRHSEDNVLWEGFPLMLSPEQATLAELVETGTLRFVRLSDGETVAELRFSGDGNRVRFENDRVNDYVHILPGEFRWSGRLPLPGDGEVEFHPGKHRVEFSIRRGAHERSIEYEFWLDTAARVLDLNGVWAVQDGPTKGWLTHGRSHGGGKVSLDTAPNVVLAGTWDQSGDLPSVDLLPDASIPRLVREMDDRITMGLVLRGLRSAEVDTGTRDLRLYGKPDGVPGDQLILERLSWRPEILKDRSTYKFDPDSGGIARHGTFGLYGGKDARIRILRSPRVDYDQQLKSFDARARVLDPEGNVLQTAYAARDASERADPDSKLRVRINSRRGRVMAIWNGRQDDGKAYPPGKYAIEVVVREGMAETTLRREVLLGLKLQITDMPRQFAPGVEDVPITFDWRPRESRASKYVLTILGGENKRVTVVKARTMMPGEVGDKLRVVWTAAEQRGDLDGKDWTTLLPLQVTLSGISSDDGVEASDSRSLTVIPTKITLEVKRPKGSTAEERKLIATNHIPVDYRALRVESQLMVLTSDNREIPVHIGDWVKWSFEVDTLHGLPDDNEQRPAILDAETRKVIGAGVYDEDAMSIEGDAMVAIKEGRSRILFRPPVHAYRESWQGQPIKPDRFRLKATVGSLEEQSAEFTMAVGAPAGVDQILSDRLSTRFNIDHFASEMWSVKRYVDTLSAQVARFFGGPPSEALTNALLGDSKSVKVRYLGKATNVPGGRTDTLQVFLAGFAGADHEALFAGQALVVMYQVVDAFGNPLPVREDAVTTVKVQGDGLVPPFVLRADRIGNREFDCKAKKVYDPFRYFRKDGVPYGIYSFFYVPGRALNTRALRKDIERLQTIQERYGDMDPLRLPADREVDNRASIQVRFRGKTLSSDTIQLVKSGSQIKLKSALRKYIKWAVFAEVTDVETLKLELTAGVIPVVGDGRDIAIHLLKKALGHELDFWDDVTYGLAVIGLIADLGDVFPPGIAVNAGIAGLKATWKLLKSLYRVGSNAVIAFYEMVKPVLDFARRMEFSDLGKLKKLVAKHLGDFLQLLEDAVRYGDGPEQLKKIFRFVDGCNPQKCLKLCTALGYFRCKLFNEFPQHTMRQLDLLARKINDYVGGRQLRETFDQLKTLGRKMAESGSDFVKSPSIMRALTNILALARKGDHKKILKSLSGLSTDVMRPLRKVLERAKFLKHLLAHPRDLALFLREIVKPRGGKWLAILLKGVEDTPAQYRRFFKQLHQKGVQRMAREAIERLAKLEGKAGPYAKLNAEMKSAKALRAELQGIKATKIPLTELITPNHIPPQGLYPLLLKAAQKQLKAAKSPARIARLTAEIKQLKKLGENTGGAINMTMKRHMDTASYGTKTSELFNDLLARVAKGKSPRKAFQEVLRKEVKEMKGIAPADNKKMYDKATQELIAYYRKLVPLLMDGY